MKKIINPWQGQPEYNCFGCAPDNPFGLHMEFYEDGDDIVSIWHPEKHFQGWVDTMHGGILSTLIDEVCGWVVTRKKQTSGFTTALNVRFRKSVSTNESQLTIRAHIAEQRRNLLFIHAEVLNTQGEVCTEGDATYFLMPEERAKEMGFIHCHVEGE
ncbi:MAG: PaaI family thioesterase [Bacteroidaceae bacterium]|nr:PaaI family thioesterase [Bacteroidaceae bacterium]